MAQVTVTGGTKWRAYLEKLARRIEVRAGVLEGATNEETGQKVAEYAAYNEFGTSRIPARPFMRQTLSEKRENWAQGFARLLCSLGADGAAKLTGQRMAEDIQAKIQSNMPPPNSLAWAAKKAKRPGPRGTLVDTGTLLKSINYEVQGD